MGNSRLTGSIVKLGTTKLSTAGTSLAISSLSIEMLPNTSLYSHLMFHANILGTTSKTIMIKLNDSSQINGTWIKLLTTTVSGAETTTAGLEAMAGAATVDSPTLHGTIGINATGFGTTLSINCTATYQNGTMVLSNGNLRTTVATILTKIELLATGNMGQYSTLTLYGIKQ